MLDRWQPEDFPGRLEKINYQPELIRGKGIATGEERELMGLPRSGMTRLFLFA